MEIIDTFVPSLYAFKLQDEELDELEKLFDNWADPQYLFNFFEKNEQDISISIEDAIRKAQKEAEFLRNKLIELTKSEPNRLHELFKNLYNNEVKPKPLSPQKAPNRWLRIYALRIDEHIYVITGGAIKLDQGTIRSRNEFEMKDRPHTLKELQKINKCRDYLKDQGVLDGDSFYEIIF